MKNDVISDYEKGEMYWPVENVKISFDAGQIVDDAFAELFSRLRVRVTIKLENLLNGKQQRRTGWSGLGVAIDMPEARDSNGEELWNLEQDFAMQPMLAAVEAEIERELDYRESIEENHPDLEKQIRIEYADAFVALADQIRSTAGN